MAAALRDVIIPKGCTNLPVDEVISVSDGIPIDSDIQTKAGEDTGEHQVVDFLHADNLKALAQAANDLADMASFAHSVSDNGQNPDKLIDAIRLLVIIQDGDYDVSVSVTGHTGLQNRFLEKWGRQPDCDVVGFLNTVHRLSLVGRDVTIRLTTKGSRLLGSMYRLLDDWYAFHTKDDLEQLLFQSEREIQLMDAYEAKGYEAHSWIRALGFLEKAYESISSRIYDLIASGAALEQVSAMLARYDFLLQTINDRRKEGFEPTLPILERVERAKSGALSTAFDAMAGILSHATGRALSEMNPINRPRFYGWLKDVFGTENVAQLAVEAGDVALPVYLPGFPSFNVLVESVEGFLGRSIALPGDPGEYVEPTYSEEGDFHDPQGEFDEDFLEYVDLVLSSLIDDRGVRESAIVSRIDTWGQAIMTAAAAGEVVTKNLADGRYLEEGYEDERLKMIGDLSLRRRRTTTPGKTQEESEESPL